MLDRPFAGLRVALVHDWLLQLRGGEKVFDQLAGLFPDADIYTLIHRPNATTAAIEQHRVFSSWVSDLPWVRSYYRKLAVFYPLYPRTSEGIKLRDYDLVVSSSHSYAKGVTVQAGTPHICYCHTPIRYVWGPRRSYFKSSFANRIAEPAMRYLAAWDIRTSSPNRVTSIVCNSEHVRRRVKSAWNRDSTVVHPGIDISRFGKISRNPKDFFLLVTAFAPYKRDDIAIEAFRKNGLRLVVVGDGEKRHKLERNLPGNVEFVGKVSDDQLDRLLGSCRALIHPQEEDFGMTAVEAQAAGVPVIAFGEGGATETVVPMQGDKAEEATGIFFREQTPDALASAIARFQEVEGRFVEHVIRGHAAKFSLEAFRTGFAEAVNSVLRRSNN